MSRYPSTLHLTVTALPWTIGGKEVFAHSLVQELRKHEHDACIVIHRDAKLSPGACDSEYEGVPIIVLPPIRVTRDRESTYSCLPSEIPGFDALIDEIKPNIVHFHDFSIGASRLHLRVAKSKGARIVMSYHSPGQSCVQRSLLFRGRSPCDGLILRNRCTSCRLSAAGMPALISDLIARLPTGTLSAQSSPLGRALSARAMTSLFVEAWAECIETVDMFQVHAYWTQQLLKQNGVPPQKLAFVAAGLPYQNSPCLSRDVRSPGKPLRIAFVGRCDPIKGIHILVKAIKHLESSEPVSVSFFGPGWDQPYAANLMDLMAGDARFNEPRLVEHSALQAVLAQHDLVVVPSVWLETGPLVVSESFGSGLPVVGSRLGGIAELVRDGVDGLLFEPGDALALSGILRELISDPECLATLARNVQPPRTFKEVAADMVGLYARL